MRPPHVPTTAPAPATDTTDAAPVYFGIERYTKELADRLDAYFRGTRTGAARGDQALVLGIYGQWGCGKTTWLTQIANEFEQRHRQRLASGLLAGPVIIPVTFNAWRFEREPHLIIPLLKTAESAIREFIDQQAPSEQGSAMISWLRTVTIRLDDAALALAAGLLGSFIPGADDMGGLTVQGYAKRRNHRDGPSALEAYESLYFDLHGHMRALMGRAGQRRPPAWQWLDEAQARAQQAARTQHQSEQQAHERAALLDELATLPWWSMRGRKRLRAGLATLDAQPGAAGPSPDKHPEQDTQQGFELSLLFLIDDLDRCLPEKAVEMLESIKLFLEVPGCAFVLALDDEIIERGITHRYRDYLGLANPGQHGPPLESPISGSEYLEKIVHLPVRVPALTRHDTRSFLLAEYPSLFAGPAAAALLDLFERCVPGVPRKVVRAAELFSLLHKLAQDLVERRCFGPPELDYDPLLLAQLVILQLFAPELYRLGVVRGYEYFLVELERLVGVDLDAEILVLERGAPLAPSPPNADTNADADADARARLLRDRLRLEVARLTREVLHQRSRFDPRQVVALGTDYVWERVEHHYRLMVFATELVAVAPGLQDDVGFDPHAIKIGRPTALDDFVALALSSSAEDWGRALAAERDQLEGRVLDADSFEQLLRVASRYVARIDLPWLETFMVHMSSAQLQRLVRETDLLRRLAANTDAGERAAELRHALTLLCRDANPPHDPGKGGQGARVSLPALLPKGATLDLSQISLRRAYLAGIDGLDGVRWPPALATPNVDADPWTGVILRGAAVPLRPPRALLEPAQPSAAPELALSLGRGALVGACLLDEGRLACAGHDGSIRIWGVDDGALLASLDGHEGWVTAVCSLGPGRLASAGVDGSVRVWDLREAGEDPLRATLKGHRGSVWSVCVIGPERIASAGEDGSVRVWDLRQVAERAQQLAIDSGQRWVWGVCAAGPGRLASAGDDGSVRVWDLEARRELAVLRGHRGRVRGVCALEGQRLASVGDDGSLRIWQLQAAASRQPELATRQPELATLDGHRGIVWAVWSLEDERVASAGDDGSVRVWDLRRGIELAALRGHQGGVRGGCTLDSARTASVGDDGSARIWSLDDAPERARPTILGGDRGALNDLCVQASGRLASAGDDGLIRSWALEHRDHGHRPPRLGHRGRVTSVCALQREGLASGGDDGTVRVWRPSGAQPIAFEGHHGRVNGVCALDGEHLASAGHDGSVRIWAVEQPPARAQVAALTGHQGPVTGVCTLGRDRLVSSGDDGSVRIWNSPNGWAAAPVELARLEGHRGAVTAVCALNDQHLASAGDDGTVRIWATASGTHAAVLEGHRGLVTSVCGLGEGRLASAGEDGTIRVWMLGEAGPQAVLKGHRGQVTSVRALAKARLASTGVDGTLRVWSLDGPLRVELPRTEVASLCFEHDPQARWPIALTRSDRPWRTRDTAGPPLPADPLLHSLVGVIGWDGARAELGMPRFRIPLHAFPSGYERWWRWSEDMHTLMLAWPEEPRARAVLRRWVFG